MPVDPMPPRLPMPHPKEDRCGHDFPIAFCPFERCVAWQLYEALSRSVCDHCFFPLGVTGKSHPYPHCSACLPTRYLLAKARGEA